MFDLDKIQRESGHLPDTLMRLKAEIKGEFQGDEMMFEHHFLRLIRAIREGWVTLEEALTRKAEDKDDSVTIR